MQKKKICSSKRTTEIGYFYDFFFFTSEVSRVNKNKPDNAFISRTPQSAVDVFSCALIQRN